VIAAGVLLPTTFFSVLLGLGIAAIGDKVKPVQAFFKYHRWSVLGHKHYYEICAIWGKGSST
jgi:Na+/H+-dicarboxylate symporter